MIIYKRRDFLKYTSLVSAGIAFPLTFKKEIQPLTKKSLKFGMIKEDLSLLDKFKLIKDLGYDGVELDSPNNLGEKEILDARDKSGILLPCLLYTSFSRNIMMINAVNCLDTEANSKISVFRRLDFFS